MSAAGQAPRVIYIHGAGNKPPAAELKGAWDDDLFQRDMGEQTQMVYYADLLHARPGAIGADACTQQEAVAGLMVGTAMAAEAASPVDLSSLDERAVGRDLELLAGLSPQGQQLGLRLMLSIATRSAAQTRAEPLAQLLPLPEPVRRLLLRELLRRLVPDADAYFFGSQREPIRNRLRQTLDAADHPAIVVSHSLGTVIAYDVLSETGFTNRPVRQLVTLGSPLGYTEIQDVITRPLRVPAPVQLWVNFADPRDIVTLDTTLADEFRGGPGVIDSRVDNRAPNNHAACGYLGAAQVRAVVTSGLVTPTAP